MNREQRRKLKNVSFIHPEVQSGLKKKEIRGKIDSLLANDKEVQKALRAEAQKYREEEERKSELDLDTLILVTLWQRFHFGHKRLLQFASAFISMYNEYRERYPDADDNMYVMRSHLKEFCGIDVEHLVEQVKEFEMNT